MGVYIYELGGKILSSALICSMDIPFYPGKMSRAKEREALWSPHSLHSLEPSSVEYKLVKQFLHIFPVEHKNFNEEEDAAWVAFKARVGGGGASLRSDVLKLLNQIRLSKGYDVDIMIEFSRFPPWSNFGVFTPRDLTEHYDLAKSATDFAIKARNLFSVLNDLDQSFKLVSIDRLVSAYKHRYCKNLLLLSFTAEETNAGRGRVRTTGFQAMVHPIGFTFGGDGAPTSFNLLEWKPTPDDVRKFNWKPRHS